MDTLHWILVLVGAWAVLLLLCLLFFMGASRRDRREQQAFDEMLRNVRAPKLSAVPKQEE